MKNIIIPILLIFSFSGYCNEQKDSLYKESVIRKLRIVNDSIDSLNQKFYKLSNEVTDLKGKTISRETIISFTSVLIAFLLLVFTIHNNKRTRRLMNIQTDEQKKLAKAQITPLINGYRNEFDKTEFIICNYGGGPAIITQFLFEKNGKTANSISDFIDIKEIDKEVDWDDNWTFRQKYYFLYPHESLQVYTITLKNLMERYKVPEDRGKRIIDEINKRRKGITVKIKYIDTFEYNKRKHENEYPYEYNL